MYLMKHEILFYNEFCTNKYQIDNTHAYKRELPCRIVTLTSRFILSSLRLANVISPHTSLFIE